MTSHITYRRIRETKIAKETEGVERRSGRDGVGEML